MKADIVCYELGFNHGADSIKMESYFGPVPPDFSYDDVNCNGTENSLEECGHINSDNCNTQEGAGVICNPNSTSGW